jgi:integrase/recombinase XerD
MSASVKIVLRQRKLSDGTYPLAFRITKDRRTSFIHLGKSIAKEDWDNKEKKVKKSHPNSGKLNTFLIDKIKEYNDLVLEIEKQKKDTSSRKIKSAIKKGNENLSFFQVAAEYLAALKAAKKFGRVSGETSRVKFFREFLKGEDIVFQEITPRLLENFIVYLKSYREVCDRTAMNYLIVVRTIFNRAIKDGLVDRRFYPFGDNNVKIRFSQSIKIGLTREEVNTIVDLDLKIGSDLWHTRNIWLIAFYFAGMRISDVLKLKWKDIIDDRMIYRMNKNQKISSIRLPEKAQAIFDYYLPDKRSMDDYIFPELKKAIPDDEKDIFTKSRTATRYCNDRLAEIAKLAKIDKKLTNHIARHTFGNISGDTISPQMLQKLYRHSDLKTTIGYQSNFIHKEADEALEKVINF